jgi:hypothetical protein
MGGGDRIVRATFTIPENEMSSILPLPSRWDRFFTWLWVKTEDADLNWPWRKTPEILFTEGVRALSQKIDQDLLEEAIALEGYSTPWG